MLHVDSPGKDSRKVLLLNASETIVGIISWQKGVTLYLNDKASAPYNFHHFHQIEVSHGQVFELPSALVLNDYVYVPDRRVIVTRRNILRRDAYRCQYCTKELDVPEIATIDHIHPQCRGGKTEWKNVVACCKKCNGKKGSKSLAESGMKLIKPPAIPTREMLSHSLAKYISKYPHWERWADKTT